MFNKKPLYKIFFEGAPKLQSKIIYNLDKSTKSSSYISLEKLLIVVIILTLAGYFVWTFIFYSTPIEKIAKYPHVHVLSKDNMISKIKFGQSPKCKDNIDCWILADFDDKDWTEVDIPNFLLKKVPSYQEGLKSGYMYYRLHVDVPKDLINLNETISFSPGWVNHEYFEVYINGRLVFVSNGINSSQTIVAVPLHKNDYAPSGKFVFGVKATLNKTDVGISHFGLVLLGPKQYIDQIFVNQERSTITFYILFFLSKGSVFIILALFYLYTGAQRGFLHFLVFAFLVMLEPLIVIKPESLNLDWRVLIFYFVKSLAISFLLRFFMEFFDIKKSIVRYLNFVSVLCVLATILMAVDRAWGTRVILGVHIYHFTNTYLIATVFLAIIFGIASYVRFSNIAFIKDEVLPTIRGFLFFLIAYFVALVISSYFINYTGHDKRAILDLFFFFYVALMNIRNFGLNEGKIASLEFHLLEKRKIEIEMEEAAAVAEAFMPQALPQWSFTKLAVHHKAISQISGDWYTFEMSNNQKVYHFILADITGHGVQAAIVVSTCKSVLSCIRKLYPERFDDDDFLKYYAELLNYTLYMQGRGHHTTTLMGLTFKPDEKILLYLSAAHPPSLYLKENEPRPRILTTRGSLVGFNPYSQYQIVKTSFNDDDELIAYTDGIPVLNYWDKLYDIKKSCTDFKQLPQYLYQKIWEQERLKYNKYPDDDVSIIWFKFAS